MNIMKCFVAWCFLIGFTSMSSAAAEKTFAVVGRSPGILAVQEQAGGPWRVIPGGCVLPDAAEIRTSGDGPCPIQFAAGDAVVLGPNARLQFNSADRRIQLFSGSVFAQTPPDRTWEIVAGAGKIEVSGASVETALDSRNAFSVTALQGTAKVAVADAAPLIVAEKMTRSWRNNAPLTDGLPLTKEQANRLAAWTGNSQPNQGLGQFVITDALGSAATRLSLARYHAELDISSPYALVKTDQVFYNASDLQQQGEFVFHLPPGASASRFAVYVTATELVEAEIIDRRKANQIDSAIGPDRKSVV